MTKAASHSFREHGYAGIGVDGLAKAAGVTSGAFYSHFGSKDAAFQAALQVGLDEVIEALPEFQNEHGKNWVKAFAEYYLGKAHRDDMACGCAMATLTPEVVRSGQNVHKVFEQKMTTICDLITKGLTGSSKKDKTSRAWTMLSILVGGLNFARAMHNEDSAEAIAKATISAVVKAANG